LNRLDRASSATDLIFVRMAKDGGGHPSKVFELTWLEDLWGETSILERHIDLKTRSTHSTVTRVERSGSWAKVLHRVRSLTRHGYYVVESSDVRLKFS